MRVATRLREKGEERTAGGVGPPPPLDPTLFDVDEGPMRGDLRRQIEELERALTRLKAAAFPWEGSQASPQRGPGMLGAEHLEQIRDELLTALTALQHRLAAKQVAELSTEPEPPTAWDRLRHALAMLRHRLRPSS